MYAICKTLAYSSGIYVLSEKKELFAGLVLSVHKLMFSTI